MQPRFLSLVVTADVDGFIADGRVAPPRRATSCANRICVRHQLQITAVPELIDRGAGTTGSPMTYSFQERQYVVVAVGSTNHPAELVALTGSPFSTGWQGFRTS